MMALVAVVVMAATALRWQRQLGESGKRSGGNSRGSMAALAASRQQPCGGGCGWRLLQLGTCGAAVGAFPRQQCNIVRAVVAAATA